MTPFARVRTSVVRALLLVPITLFTIKAQKPALAPEQIDAIARLLMLEDQRQFDSSALATYFTSSHPEVRRRAALAIARINDKRGIALLRARQLDGDTSIAATTVFAVGHLRDSSTVAWFDSLLSNPRTPPTAATEAAIALGKIKTAGARAVLVKYLNTATATALTSPTIGEALLAMGRVPRGDVAPLVRWTSSADEEIRWRATWALFRPRDPAGIATLLKMSKDPSGHVRSWAIRGLTKPHVDSANVAKEAEDLLLSAVSDGDRRVRTEAVRALASYTDDAAVAALIKALADEDSWMFVSAAEGLGRAKSRASVAALVAATQEGKPCALRVVAKQALDSFTVAEAFDAAVRIARDTTPYCRTFAGQALARASRAGGDDPDLTRRRQIAADSLKAFKAARLRDLRAPDPLTRIAALRALSPIADSAELVALQNARQLTDTTPQVAFVASAVSLAIERRLATAPGQGGRGGGGGGRGRPPIPQRGFEEYRTIVERWVVPEYDGKPRPVAVWDTPRGPIEIELYPGDAPLAVDDFVNVMRRGIIAGTEFTRVVPDFVDQQQGIRSGHTLRDEVNRRGLTRGNLAWATGGLDTGTPGYTLGHTPQPHNEGDFTSMGRVIRGMDAVDRIQLGDRILSGRMLPPPPPSR